ncbi:MAG: hypothetical protein CMB79_16270 [Filomicrobium sp.]|nr:hypothetical protein [Filomicrobium sp.]
MFLFTKQDDALRFVMLEKSSSQSMCSIKMADCVWENFPKLKIPCLTEHHPKSTGWWGSA